MMGMPEEYKANGIALDKENNDVVVRCPKCSDYGPKRIDADEYDDEKKLMNQAKRQLGSHYSQVHGSSSGGQGGTTSGNEPSNGGQGQPSSQGQNHQQSSGQAPSQQPQQQGDQNAGSEYGGSTNERELIYRKGKEGLLEIKCERLKDWLQDAGGVGGQTEARIMKVFRNTESVNSNPYALYNMLEDETSASGSYINTMVENVFEPERKYEDLLESTGYTPFFQRSGGGGQFASQGQAMGSQQHGGMGGQQYGQRGGMQQSRGRQQANQQSQQRQRREKDSGSSDDLSKQEVAQMISQGINVAQEEAEENPIKDGLSDATDEALREMASNVGSMAGTANRVFEEALMSYAQENPEFIVENMSVLQSILGATQDADSGGNSQNSRESQSSQKVDQAVSQLSDGGSPAGQQRNTQPTQQGGTNLEPDVPEPDIDTDVGPEDSGFEPRYEQEDSSRKRQGVAEQPPLEDQIDEEPPDQMPTPGDDESDKSKQKRQEFENNNTNDKHSGDEDDGFDEIFGDMAD